MARTGYKSWSQEVKCFFLQDIHFGMFRSFFSLRKSLFVRIWSLVPVLSTILKFVNFCSKEGFGINIAFEPDLYFGSEFLVNIMFWPDLRYFCFVVRYRTNQLIYTTYIGHTRDGNSSENFIPRGIEESRNNKFTFLGDRGICYLFLGVLGEFRGMSYPKNPKIPLKIQKKNSA